MPAEAWALDAVRAEMEVAADTSETRSVAGLRETHGIGHDDLIAVLDQLRQEGLAIEAAPGEWRGPFMDEQADASPARTAARREPREAEEPGMSLAQAERQAGALAVMERREPVGEEKRTTLSRGVAQALDAAALGALVKAGIDEAMEASVAFVFEVAP